MSIQDVIAENVIQDFYTAKVKCEVTLDMLLTPIIEDIIESFGYSNACLLAKEFPMYKVDDNDNILFDKGTVNADYLLSCEGKLLLVELKTTDGSIEKEQREKYERILSKINKSTDYDLFRQFKQILVNGSGCGNRFSKSVDEYKLSEILYRIIGNSDNQEPKTDFSKSNEKYKEIAKEYLERTGKSGSAKYLLQAGQILDACQMLDSCKDPEKLFKRKLAKVELFYLLPNNDSAASFKSVLEKEPIDNKIKEKIGCGTLSAYAGKMSESKTLSSYNAWLIEDVLAKLFTDGDNK